MALNVISCKILSFCLRFDALKKARLRLWKMDVNILITAMKHRIAISQNHKKIAQGPFYLTQIDFDPSFDK